MTHKITAA